MAQINPERLEELKRHRDESSRPTEEEKEKDQPWMSPDAGGLYCYLVFDIAGEYFAIDDDYCDINAGVSDYLKDIDISKWSFSSIKGKIRYVINLAERLGYEEKTNEKSIVLHIKPKQLGKQHEDEDISIILHNFPNMREFEKIEIVDPREFGDTSFPDYVPRVIDTDVGLIRILNLEKLLKEENYRKTEHDDKRESSLSF